VLWPVVLHVSEGAMANRQRKRRDVSSCLSIAARPRDILRMKQPPDNVIALPDQPVTLGDVLAEVRGVRELLEQLVSVPSGSRQWLTVEQAAALLHRTPQAIRFRCRNGLGVKIRGKWRISRDQLFS
jgi:hypothetical protein